MSAADKERFQAFLPLLHKGLARYTGLLREQIKAKVSLTKVQAALAEDRIPPALRISVKPQLDPGVFERKVDNLTPSPKETWDKTTHDAERNLLQVVLATRTKTLQKLDAEIQGYPELLAKSVRDVRDQVPEPLKAQLPNDDAIRSLVMSKLALLHASFVQREAKRKADAERAAEKKAQVEMEVDKAPTRENLAQLVQSAVKRELAKALAKNQKQPKNVQGPQQSKVAATKPKPRPTGQRKGAKTLPEAGKGRNDKGAGLANRKAGKMREKKRSGGGPRPRPSSH
jgi:hypothetical protein